MSIFDENASDEDKQANIRKMAAKATRIIAFTRKVMGTSCPPDLVTALIFTIGELCDTSTSPAAALQVVADQFKALAEIERRCTPEERLS